MKEKVRIINYFVFIGIILLSVGIVACSQPKKNSQANDQKKDSDSGKQEGKIREKKKNPAEYLTNGFVVFEEIYGDINNDKVEDCILITKGNNKDHIIKDDDFGETDRNRRGIMVLLNRKNNYELMLKNDTCFSSANADGGVYFAPELMVKIKKGNLYIEYNHGRYGYKKYCF